jgi:hypothetical protein
MAVEAVRRIDGQSFLRMVIDSAVVSFDSMVVIVLVGLAGVHRPTAVSKSQDIPPVK